MRILPIATLGLALLLGSVPLTAMAQEYQPLQRQPLDRIVAIVNEQAVMQSRLDERMAQVRSQLVAQGQELPPEGMLRERLLDQIILEEIQLQMAANAGLSIDDTTLNRQVRQIAESNGMTLDQFADALEADGLSVAVVREEIRREMVLRELHQRQIGGRVNISDREVERFIDQQGGNISADQARQALFQRKANEALDTWLQEIRAEAYVDNRLATGR
ncbi:MAG TPA: SurA N-terminal domain-containing protein [Candidatus Halomonas stercoripullorum]|uniref:SurA N-terminal domain-containing protein n=1 Tax=Candidatus Halomonas stercoripullorum TaxID=2838617 RepID=A0A9D1WMB4_9GAMM|nr:SurA N-terminal domain-containing protein [Candidatus Halomonas stercoripullorum]